LDNLGLRLLALEEARSREPASWSLAYQSGLAVLEYRDVASLAGEERAAIMLEEESDWLGLREAEAWQGPPGVGQAVGSLANPAAEVETFAALSSLRELDSDLLTERARQHLRDAQELNPRQAEIREALAGLGR
jgi:hypothetical protein